MDRAPETGPLWWPSECLQPFRVETSAFIFNQEGCIKSINQHTFFTVAFFTVAFFMRR